MECHGGQAESRALSHTRWHRRYIVVFSCKVYHIVGCPFRNTLCGDKGALDGEERHPFHETRTVFYTTMVLVRIWGDDSPSQPMADSSLWEGALKNPSFQRFPKASLLEGGGPEGVGGSASPHFLTNTTTIYR